MANVHFNAIICIKILKICVKKKKNFIFEEIQFIDKLIFKSYNYKLIITNNMPKYPKCAKLCAIQLCITIVMKRICNT